METWKLTNFGNANMLAKVLAKYRKLNTVDCT